MNKPRIRVNTNLPHYVQQVPCKDLKPHPDNPRKHSGKQIKRLAMAIKQFGFRVPILVDANNRVICGHGRLAACKQLGYATVPVLRAEDLSDDEVRALMVADNQLGDLSDWDTALLSENLKLIFDSELDFSAESLGFDYGQVEAFIIEHEGTTDAANDEPIPDIAQTPSVAKPGDLWVLGDHRILCGDSTSPQSYDTLLGAEQVNIVFTDPPYNLSPASIGQVCAKQHGKFAHASGEMSPAEFTAFLSGIFQQLCQRSVNGAIFYVCMDWRHIHELLGAAGEHSVVLKNLCIWVKDRAGMGTFYRSQHELVFVFKCGDAEHQNNFELGQHGRFRSNVWQYPAASGFRSADGDPEGALSLHPTIKPVAMIENALLDCSQRGQIVLDPFLGSGSTLIAAEKAGRRCFGIELSPRYVDVAISRWEQWTGRKARREAVAADVTQDLVSEVNPDE